jgi:hypothetical protein
MNIQAYREAMARKGPMADEWRDKPHRLIYDLCDALEEKRKTVWTVFSHDERQRMFLGYATGEKADIEAFFDNRKAYSLELEHVEIQHIPAGFADKRAALLQQREKHEAEVARINAELKQFGG